MLTRSQIDKRIAERALKAEDLTPGHAAARAGLGIEDGETADEAERRRRRVQHEADPYLHEGDLPEVAHADLPKAFNQAFDTPDGYPPMHLVNAEEFRRPPIADGRAAYSPGYGPPDRAVPVPSAPLAPGMISRPVLTDGRARLGVPRESC